MSLRNSFLGTVSVLAIVSLSGCDGKTDGVSNADVNQAIADHAGQAGAHHLKTTDASELNTGTLDAARLPTTISAADFSYSTPQTGQVRVPFSGFSQRVGFGTFDLQKGFAQSSIVAGPSQGFASVDLPIGATVTRFACTMSRGLAGSSQTIRLVEYDAAGVETVMAQVSPNVTGNPQVYADTETTVITNATVVVSSDYVVWAFINNAAATVSNAHLKGCIVDYTVPSVIP